MEVYPPMCMKLKVCVDDTTALLEGRCKELPGIAETRAMRMEEEEKGSEAVDHGWRKQREEQGPCVMQFTGEVSGM